MFVFVRPEVIKMIHSRCVLFEYLLKHSLLYLAQHTYQIYIYKCLKSFTVHRNKTRRKTPEFHNISQWSEVRIWRKQVLNITQLLWSMYTSKLEILWSMSNWISIVPWKGKVRRVLQHTVCNDYTIYLFALYLFLFLYIYI